MLIVSKSLKLEKKPAQKKFNLIGSDDDSDDDDESDFAQQKTMSKTQKEAVNMFESKLNLDEKQANQVKKKD